MTTELIYLTLTAILTGVLWIPAVIGQVQSRGTLKPEDYVTLPNSPLADWAVRANRAHVNAVENLGAFAAVVIVAHLAGVSTGLTAAAAAVYFFARLIHAVVFISGFKHFMARTLLFTISWLAFLVIAIEVLRHSL
ncbi:hypothetical protein OAN307_c02550 [Octadecabacter antarcticus 307]|uniref:MAPEG family protein n=1 Tax=Octadecabacter antarcticus 307 TaxID=391626 RepID=M9R6S4_9RHOB|nr:MAPEG family protein [Octadecabacter antarcticus]AGI66016.1 hypothetical protein OAN307_c02550 [Octadecabacter antarcticus 307]